MWNLALRGLGLCYLEESKKTFITKCQEEIIDIFNIILTIRLNYSTKRIIWSFISKYHNINHKLETRSQTEDINMETSEGKTERYLLRDSKDRSPIKEIPNTENKYIYIYLLYIYIYISHTRTIKIFKDLIQDINNGLVDKSLISDKCKHFQNISNTTETSKFSLDLDEFFATLKNKLLTEDGIKVKRFIFYLHNIYNNSLSQNIRRKSFQYIVRYFSQNSDFIRNLYKYSIILNKEESYHNMRTLINNLQLQIKRLNVLYIYIYIIENIQIGEGKLRDYREYSENSG